MTPQDKDDMTIKVINRDETSIILRIPVKLNAAIDHHLVDMREMGVKRTKADLCVTLMQLGMNVIKNFKQ